MQSVRRDERLGEQGSGENDENQKGRDAVEKETFFFPLLNQRLV